MKKSPLILFLLLSLQIFAQDGPQTLYWNNYSITNPAATGLFNKHYASVTGRKQWMNMDGAPTTIYAIYDYQFSKHQSIGTNYIFDQIGIMKTNKVNLNYAFRIPLTEKANLSFGTSLNVRNINLDPNWITPDGGNDPSIPTNYSKNYTDVNFGTMFKTEKIIFGISYIDGFNKENTHKVFSTFSYDLNLTKNLKIRPGFQFVNHKYKSNYNQSHIDFNLTSTYKNIFSLGMTYRTNDWICFNAGIDIKNKFRICYAFDYYHSKLNSAIGSTHEIGLVMTLK